MTRYHGFTRRRSVLLLILSVPGLVLAQNQPGYRVIKVDNSSRHSPVRFSGIRCAGREVESGVPFLDPPQDWLDDCTIRLTNYIQKVVVAAHITALAPESGKGTPSDPIVSSSIVIGQLPSWQTKDRSRKPQNEGASIAVHYGESTVIACSKLTPTLERLVAEKGKPSSGISEVLVSLSMVDFSDGTQSQLGTNNFYKPNVAAGRGYIRIGRDEFYEGIEPPK